MYLQGLDMYDRDTLDKYLKEYKHYGMRVSVLGWRESKIAVEYLNHSDKTVVKLISLDRLQTGLENVHLDAQPIDIC